MSPSRLASVVSALGLLSSAVSASADTVTLSASSLITVDGTVYKLAVVTESACSLPQTSDVFPTTSTDAATSAVSSSASSVPTPTIVSSSADSSSSSSIIVSSSADGYPSSSTEIVISSSSPVVSSSVVASSSGLSSSAVYATDASTSVVVSSSAVSSTASSSDATSTGAVSSSAASSGVASSSVASSSAASSSVASSSDVSDVASSTIASSSAASSTAASSGTVSLSPISSGAVSSSVASSSTVSSAVSSSVVSSVASSSAITSAAESSSAIPDTTSTAVSSTASAVAPSCNVQGYDKGTPAAYYGDSSNTSYEKCSALCLADSNCLSFAYSTTICLLYSAPVAGNSNPVADSPNNFYDKACIATATSSSVLSASSTAVSSTGSSSQVASSSSVLVSSSSASQSVSSSTASTSVASSTAVSSSIVSSSSAVSSSQSSSAISTSSIASVTSSSTVLSSSSTISSATSSSASASSTAIASKVETTILVIATTDDVAYNMYSGLRAYGIPYQVLLVPSGGIALPTLQSNGVGNFGGFVIYSDVQYEQSGNYVSALTEEQWQSLYDYQTTFGVRMTRISVWPDSSFGVEAANNGCCDENVEQYWQFTNTSGFATSGLKEDQSLSTANLWHTTARIIDSKTTFEVAKFLAGPSDAGETTAAVINNFENGSGYRQQMVFFIDFATQWSTTSNVLQHAWIHFMTRGLYTGFRRTYFGTQIDDNQLATGLYWPTGSEYRVVPDDYAEHARWTPEIQAKMNKGSTYFIELGHNGNGNIQASTLADTQNLCNPETAIYWNYAYTGEEEWKKPLGTGVTHWPSTPTEFTWNLACAEIDPLLAWLREPANLNAFAHLSHTFTHLDLQNSTYEDTSKEISWNIDWMNLVGISQATRFSANGLIPPAITGMHNGDAIRAWMDNGIKYVVGDNSRPVLLNTENAHWPLTSNYEDNGHDGLEIIPRWPTSIYFNCDTPDCTTLQWNTTSGNTGDFSALLDFERDATTAYLIGLRHDPYMFHQANLRFVGAPTYTANGVTASKSLLQWWVETCVEEFTRIVDWPMVTLTHDEIAAGFIDRRTRDSCAPSLTWNYSQDGKSIVGASVSASSGSCDVALPVTFPVAVKDTQGGRTEQLGNDPLTVWVNLSGSPVSFELATPIVL